MPVARKKLARRGVANTSCRQPFPGHPGLSQPCSQRRLSGRCASTVLSRNELRQCRRQRGIEVFVLNNFLTGGGGE